MKKTDNFMMITYSIMKLPPGLRLGGGCVFW